MVHEHPRIGSDGESEEGSRTSEDVVSPANRQNGGAGDPAAAGGGGGAASGGLGPFGGVKLRTKNGSSSSSAESTRGVGIPGVAASGGAGSLASMAGGGNGANSQQLQQHQVLALRKLSSQEEINKRLSLPADLKLPDNFLEKQAVSPTLEGPLSRATRRQSLSEIGFGRMDTYTKLDKLGEVMRSRKFIYINYK